MIYVYRRQPSDSARELARALGRGVAKRIMEMPRGLIRPEDRIVCWGERLAGDSNQILNGAPFRTKYEDALKLREERIPTIEVVLDTPLRTDNVAPHQRRLEHVGRRMQEHLAASQWEQVNALLNDFRAAQEHLQAALANRSPTFEWLPRSNHHVGGNDLLTPPERTDYFVKREILVREYRVHSFLGKSIRTGTKVHRDNAPSHHAWIRSYDAGWRISYDKPEKRGLRDLAHRAVSALGLQFGAVDVGEKEDGTLLVLEVNRAPGVEAGTTEAYAKAIAAWAGVRS